MTSRERMLIALNRQKPDRLPVTVHQWQPYHLKTHMGGMSDIEACKATGLDAAITVFETLEQLNPGWQVETKRRGINGVVETEYTITTPKGILTEKTGSNAMTTWVTEHLVKRPEDIKLVAAYMPVPKLNAGLVAEKREALGDGGILRTFIPFKQGGCWQDACELFGAEALIYACYDDPSWVHEFLEALLQQKLRYIEENLAGMPLDLIETGGGAASNTLISPQLHEEFCLPYDRRLHAAIRSLGFPVVYHTCGGMSKITHCIVENGCDISETLSPTTIGGDIGDDETARRVYAALFPRVALIGGFDQFGLLERGTKQAIEREVARLFGLYGQNGGYLLSAADHFFEAPRENIEAFAAAAREFIY